MFDLLIIDLDGTLVDSRIDITNALNLSLKEFNLDPVDSDIISKHVGVGIRPIIKNIVPNELLNEFLVVFDKNYINGIAVYSKIYEGWLEVLNKTPHVKKVILSNKSQKFCDPLVKSLGLTQLFTNIYGGEAFEERKPSPLPVLEILKKLNCSHNSTLIIGDTINDIEAGRAAQIKTCGALFGYSKRTEILELKPDFVIESPLDLLSII